MNNTYNIPDRDEHSNLGFVFFPIGDLILGTYKGKLKSIYEK